MQLSDKINNAETNKFINIVSDEENELIKKNRNDEEEEAAKNSDKEIVSNTFEEYDAATGEKITHDPEASSI